jgi:hypothetical protein
MIFLIKITKLQVRHYNLSEGLVSKHIRGGERIWR